MLCILTEVFFGRQARLFFLSGYIPLLAMAASHQDAMMSDKQNKTTNYQLMQKVI